MKIKKYNKNKIFNYKNNKKQLYKINIILIMMMIYNYINKADNKIKDNINKLFKNKMLISS